MHDASEEDEDLFYWLEGRIQQRVTKTSRAKKLKYTENYFDIGDLQVVRMWGKQHSLSLAVYAQIWLLILDGS